MYNVDTTKAALAGLPLGIRTLEVKKMLTVIIKAAEHYNLDVAITADREVIVNEKSVEVQHTATST